MSNSSVYQWKSALKLSQCEEQRVLCYFHYPDHMSSFTEHWSQICTILFFSSGSAESLCSKHLKSCTDWSGRGSVPTSGGSESGAPGGFPDCSIWRTVVFCCLMVSSDTRSSRSIAKRKNRRWGVKSAQVLQHFYFILLHMFFFFIVQLYRHLWLF